MKRAFCLLLLLSLFCKISAQEYDLIVKSNGDSVVCKIDTITDQTLYLEMKVNYSWVETSIANSNVLNYQKGVIEYNDYLYQPGTSVILGPKEKLTGFSSLPRNSIFLGLFTIYYQRLIPLEKAAFTISGGLNFFGTIIPDFADTPVWLTLESTVLIGGTKHFFEPGIQVVYDFENNPIAFVKLGYRFQARQGFLFRIGILGGFMDGFAVAPSLSLGYSF